jgi:hypothetical protein
VSRPRSDREVIVEALLLCEDLIGDLSPGDDLRVAQTYAAVEEALRITDKWGGAFEVDQP